MNKNMDTKFVKPRVGNFVLLLLVSAMLPTASALADEPAAPYVNPSLAASTYNVTHTASDFTPVAGPVGPSRRLRADEIQWAKVGPINSVPPLYSGPYPNGKRVIWIGGYDRVAKLDADTLEVLTTYTIGEKNWFDEKEIERDVATMDTLDRFGKTRELVDYNIKLWKEPWRDIVSYYRMLSKDNEFYLAYRAHDGSVSLRVYGEADASNPASEIELRREWKIPVEIAHGRIDGLDMTPDGWIVMVTLDGVVIALSRDFTQHHVLKLPSKSEERPGGEDQFATFVRNGLSTDDQGGIYVVSRDYLYRVQWTGSKLSLDEADGGWKVSYPNDLGVGSGTNPALIGWGPKEDHLVGIADGARRNNMMVFWRDAIPAGWKGLPGYDRRVAGITPISFSDAKDERVQVENALVVYGYGAFAGNSYPQHPVDYPGDAQTKYLAGTFQMHLPGHEIRGGTMIKWDPQTRTLKTAWRSRDNLVVTGQMVSGATRLLYSMGLRNREWTIEGIDWDTGKSAFHYILGKSQRYSNIGAPLNIAPNGAIDSSCMVGLGMVRIMPREDRKTAK